MNAWRDLGRKDRRQLLLLLALGCAGVLLILIGQLGSPGRDPAPQLPDLRLPDAPSQPVFDAGTAEQAAGLPLLAAERVLSEKAAELLAQIQGVGEVDVWVTLARGVEVVYVADDQESFSDRIETDGQGGERRQTDRQHSGQTLTVRRGGEDRPLVRRIEAADVAGVLVVADGLHDPVVRLRVQEALQALFGLPAHRISMMPREGGL